MPDRPDTQQSPIASLRLSSPRGRGLRIIASAIMGLIGICFLIPLAWIVLSAFDPAATVSISIPETWTLANFTEIANVDETLRPLWNSLLISFGTAAITVVVATLAAYPLSRFQMRFNKGFMYTILFGTCLPITAMMVPVYTLFVSFQLLDSVAGTILFMAATSLPMAIWMMKNFMDSVPISLEEASWVDGASAMTALWRIVVPLMKPGIAVVFIFVFTGAWGNFFVPFVLLFSPEHQPAAVAIYNFFGTHGSIAYGKLAAFSIFYSTPVLLLYLIVQRRVGGGFAMAGAVKG
ncbi:carbohydrate ABC transporter membrane protein 2, CUT1 family [Actinomyces ruminicola]|uniref:Carbohydrate ABC transporter membrane protein 2, CUT1 family n=1 Tax=Actinomyces ruminicola TaxID=332524 RepID=A0A1H0E0D3_9ACTO|nr:carbohydrate ABC transporter permease [Actinomyces ruminicola]SDN75788.1 carbohydrate ABC transporter membrane protein 2, CUT1 family [Actinomyces ruminicola]